jgi:hypothetical protein
MKFRVHFENNEGERKVETVDAEHPEKAANIIRKKHEGSFVIKTKIDREAA